jgi:co-chaperonin GroES (HSP10)
MKQRVLAGRILVKPVAVKKETDGGIIIPGNVDKRPSSGTIVARGKDTPDVEMELREGDFVVFREGVGQEVEIDENPYILMTQKDTLYFIRD